MGLMLATTSPLPVTLDTPTHWVRFAQGFEFDIAYRLKSRGEARGGRVNVQQAAAVGNLRILKGDSDMKADKGAFQLATNFATPLTTFDLLLETQADVDGKTITITSPAIEVQVVPGFTVDLSKTVIEVAPGSHAEVAGRVTREPTFEGAEIKVEAQDLPDGVRCEPVTLGADQRDFTLKCDAGAAAATGAHEIRIASAAPNTGRRAKAEYKIGDLAAKLVVTPAKVASNR
jgi:hypothetical protein